MSPLRVLLSLITAVGALALSPAFADEAADAFRDLYGKQIAQVTATNDRADDLELAKSMLAAMGASSDQGLLTLLCGNAYELAMRSSEGYGLAIESMRVLAARVPAQEAAAREKLIAVLERQMRYGRANERSEAGEALMIELETAGDAQGAQKNHAAALLLYRRALVAANQIKSDARPALQEKIDRVTMQQRADNRVRELRDRLTANPKDRPAADELLRLLIVDLNDPAEAKQYLFLYEGTMRRNIELSEAQALEVDSAPDALALAQWDHGYAGHGRPRLQALAAAKGEGDVRALPPPAPRAGF